MADKIEQQNVENIAGGDASAAKEYVPFNPDSIKEEKKDNVDIDKADERNQGVIDKDTILHEKVHTTKGGGFNQQGEEFIQNNPDKKDRVPAGANIPNDLQELQKGNPLGKMFQRISTKLLGKDNQ